MLFFVIVAVLFLKFASHPSSHNWETDINAVFLRSGKRWIVRADLEILFKGNNPVCVDWMMDPFGMLTEMVFLVSCILVHGVVNNPKCPVVPVSRMALWLLQYFSNC